MTSDAADTRSRDQVSTWLSFGNLILTLGKDTFEMVDNWERFKGPPDEYPDLHFVKPTINSAVADFGISLPEHFMPPLDSPSPSHHDWKTNWIARHGAIPLEERLWCLSVLNVAFDTIKGHVRKSLDLDEASSDSTHLADKALKTVCGEILHIDRLPPSGEPHLEDIDFDPESDMKLAFDVVIHIHAHSKLAEHLKAHCVPERGPNQGQGAEASPFHPPDWSIGMDPSTWGFEIYSTPHWVEALEKWNGRIEQRILKHSVMKACDEAVARIRAGKKYILKGYAEQQSENEDQERMRHLLRVPDPNDLDLQGLSIGLTSSSAASDGDRREDLARISDKRVMALVRRLDDPDAFVNQLDKKPPWAAVRGPPEPASPEEQPNSASSEATSGSGGPTSDGTGLLNSQDSSCDADEESSSECSTPRASTPVAEALSIPSYDAVASTPAKEADCQDPASATR